MAPAEKAKGQDGSGNEGYRRLKQSGGRFLGCEYGGTDEEELLARIAELEKQVATKKAGKLEFKVSEKGGISVYGLGRFPVTLYAEQWEKLLDAAAELRTFVEEEKQKGTLKLKRVSE